MMRARDSVTVKRLRGPARRLVAPARGFKFIARAVSDHWHDILVNLKLRGAGLRPGPAEPAPWHWLTEHWHGTEHRDRDPGRATAARRWPRLRVTRRVAGTVTDHCGGTAAG